jgi:integrase
MGIGAASVLSLADARETAREVRKQILKGLDPIEVRRRERRRVVPTFKDCAQQFIALNSAGWKSQKHKRQWKNTLETYVYPTLGKVPVDHVETADVLRILQPIWTSKPETAVRIRGRIERILSWAAAQKFRARDNPATWRNHLDAILPKRSMVRAVKHHRALPWREVPGFIQALRQREGMAAKALEFLILTAARSGEVRGATWTELDLDHRIWTIPADRMKSGREHRVPLSGPAVKLLQDLPAFKDEEHVFPSTRGGELSDMALSAVLRRMEVDAVPHGFRSCFRDWCSETTRYPREVAEMALAHAIPSGVEAAYRRGDLFEKRRQLMEEWSTYCTTPPAADERGRVLEIGRGR